MNDITKKIQEEINREAIELLMKRNLKEPAHYLNQSQEYSINDATDYIPNFRFAIIHLEYAGFDFEAEYLQQHVDNLLER